MIDSRSSALHRLVGMLRSPRATLKVAIAAPRSVSLAMMILGISAVSTVGFLLTDVGRLAALDQQVRQLESFGVRVTDDTYADLREWAPYRPALSGAIILIGWPLLWASAAAMAKAIGERIFRRGVEYSQVLAVVVHASAVLALRSVVAAPVNYARESLGGATSLTAVLPSFSESAFPARLLGAVDIFVLWWMALVAIGLGMLYGARALPIARWLLGVYAGGAALLAVTQGVRGGI